MHITHHATDEQPGWTSHTNKQRLPVVLVPGGVNPAALSYGPLLASIKEEAEVLLKDLEVYAAETPPPTYTLETEVEGLRQAAEAANFTSFHLMGYSGGGAVSLAFTATYPASVRSLALIEPAWIGAGPTPEEIAYFEEHEAIMQLPPEQLMPAFLRANMRPGLEPPPPPPGPPPAWMAKRPAGLQAMIRAFQHAQIDRARFRDFRRPVYLAVGSLSHPIEAHKASILSSLFPDIQVEVYGGRHHFDPPQRAEPAQFAQALGKLWRRSMEAANSTR